MKRRYSGAALNGGAGDGGIQTLTRRPLRISVLISITGACLLLSGCFAPLIIPLIYGGIAAGSFMAYKTVQTVSGGKVVVAFASADSKHATPPKVLPAAQVVGVWSGTEREYKFAQTLEVDGVVRVVRLREDLLPADSGARNRAYDQACSQQQLDQIFGAVVGNEIVKSGALSFGRGGVTRNYTLEGYGCADHHLVWTDTMSVTVQSGTGTTPQTEVDDVAGQAWGERVIQARAKT